MKAAVTFITLLLAGCATSPSASIEWSIKDPGCYQKGAMDAFLAPDDDMGLTDLRIGALPDTGGGPGLMVHFRRHVSGLFAQDLGQPDLLFAVGRWKLSCVIVVSSSTCPQAEAIYKDLEAASIPVGFAFDDPTGIEVTHGTTYFLSSRDGQGNRINWSYYGSDHPLQKKIGAALDELSACAKPAEIEFRKHDSY